MQPGAGPCGQAIAVNGRLVVCESSPTRCLHQHARTVSCFPDIVAPFSGALPPGNSTGGPVRRMVAWLRANRFTWGGAHASGAAGPTATRTNFRVSQSADRRMVLAARPLCYALGMPHCHRSGGFRLRHWQLMAANRIFRTSRTGTFPRCTCPTPRPAKEPNGCLAAPTPAASPHRPLADCDSLSVGACVGHAWD